MFGLRFLQASLLVPVGTRALRRPASRGKRTEALSPLELEWKQYRAAQERHNRHNLSTRFMGLMRRLRATFDACVAAGKTLLPALDGSFCNHTVFRTELVRPTRHRKRKSGRYYYRQAAYLLTTVVEGSVHELLQIDFDRWQIEVNHREEKDTPGVGQAQLRNVTAQFPNDPALPWPVMVRCCRRRCRPSGPNEARPTRLFPSGAAARPGLRLWI
jgi:hypothetical protein